MALRRLKKELKDSLSTSSPHRMPDNCYAEPQNEDDYFVWTTLLVGPQNTPYQDGHFYIKFQFPQDYPFKPPKMQFQTKIYHPQINDKGGFCLSGGQDRDTWSPALTMMSLMGFIKDMLINPDPEFPMVPEIANLLNSNKQKYNQNATDWTLKYAKPLIDQPILKNLQFQYCINKQHIKCNFDIQSSNKHLKKFPELSLAVLCDSIAHKIPINKQSVFSDTNNYSVTIPYKMEYGTKLTIESYLEYKQDTNTQYNVLKFSRRYYDLWLDELSKEEYFLLTLGFMKAMTKELSIDIPLEIIKLCHNFYYYYKYWITFTWNKNGNEEKAKIRVQTARDINYYQLSYTIQSKWIKTKFLEAFNFVDAGGRDMGYMYGYGIICVRTSKSDDAEYPRTLNVTMDKKPSGSYLMYQAEYKNKLKRIICHIGVPKNKSLEFVLNTVKDKFEINEDVDKIQILVHNASITDEHNIRQLFNDYGFVQCTIAIKGE